MPVLGLSSSKLPWLDCLVLYCILLQMLCYSCAQITFLIYCKDSGHVCAWLPATSTPVLLVPQAWSPEPRFTESTHTLPCPMTHAWTGPARLGLQQSVAIGQIVIKVVPGLLTPRVTSLVLVGLRLQTAEGAGRIFHAS